MSRRLHYHRGWRSPITTWPLDRPIDLRRTVQMMTMWGATTWLKADESGVWWARRTRSGEGTVRVVHAGDHLAGEAWGDGGDWLLARVPELLGLDRPGVEAVPDAHPLVTELKRRFAGLRIGCVGELYPRLVATALAQKVSGANSKPALRQVAWRFGSTPPGPRDDLRLLPPPRQLARIPYYELHPLNIERHRAELISRIADRASALDRALAMPHPQARAHLEKLRGIGPWTSGVALSCALGDPDAVPLADWHLPNIVSWNLAGEPRADDARMLELLEPFRGFRSLVARMLKTGGQGPPRFGPRLAVRDIRGQ